MYPAKTRFEIFANRQKSGLAYIDARAWLASKKGSVAVLDSRAVKLSTEPRESAHSCRKQYAASEAPATRTRATN